MERTNRTNLHRSDSGGCSTHQEAQSLTDDNINQLNAAPSAHDDAFGSSQVRQETIQSYHRALYYWNSQESVNEFQGQLVVDIDDSDRPHVSDLESIGRQYQQSTSSATVMERFSFLSAQNEGIAVEAQHAMAGVGVSGGSWEHLHPRSDAARVVASATERPSTSSSTEALAPSTPPPTNSDNELERDETFAESRNEEVDISFMYATLHYKRVSLNAASGKSRVRRPPTVRMRKPAMPNETSPGNADD